MINQTLFNEAHSLDTIHGNHKIFVSWMLGNQCTYKCSYCNDSYHGGNHKFPSKEKIFEVFNTFDSPIKVMFLGGEPTYHPDFEEIVLEKPNHVTIQLISNGSRPLAFWERISQQLDLIILTYHIEYAKLERFKEIASACKNKLSRINLPMLPTRWSECMEVFNSLTASGFKVSPKVLLEDFGHTANKYLQGYNKEQLDWINSNQDAAVHTMKLIDIAGAAFNKTNPSELLAQKFTNFKGWECESPKWNVSILADGRVFDTACKQRKQLGTIMGGFTLDRSPVICEQHFCWCYSDLHSKKTRTLNDNT